MTSSGKRTLASTVRQSNSTGAWKTMPYSRSRRACSADLPLTSQVPDEGAMRLPTTRSSVDLPQPEGPMSEMNSRWPTSRSMPVSATVGSLPLTGKTFSTPLSRTAGSVVCCMSLTLPSVPRIRPWPDRRSRAGGC